MELTIEILKPEQWEEYKEIRLQALKTDPTAYGASYEENVNKSPEEWKRALTKPGSIIYVAKVNGRNVGLARSQVENTKNINHLAEIFSVFVDPTFRKQGIGHKLMQKILEDLHKNSKTVVVFLNVNVEQEAAIKLYEKLGFKKFGIAENEMRVENKYYAQAHMYLTFRDKL